MNEQPLAIHQGRRALGSPSYSTACETKDVACVPGKRLPPRWYTFSRPRWELMPLSLRKSAWDGYTIEAHRAQIREMIKLWEFHHADEATLLSMAKG